MSTELPGYSDLPVVLNLPYERLLADSSSIYGVWRGQLSRWYLDDEDLSPTVFSISGSPNEYRTGGPGACVIQGRTAQCHIILGCEEPRLVGGDFVRTRLEYEFDSPITSVASNGKSCVSLRDGTVFCWGEHFLSDDDPHCIYDEPVQVAGLTDVVEVAPAPSDSICALRADGSVLCWGRNDSDQFGVPEAELPVSEIPRRAPLPGPTARLIGADSGLATLQVNGSVYFWGHPIVPERLGRAGPQKAELPLPAVDVLVMSYGVCALPTDHSVRCVGGRFDRRRRQHGPDAATPFEGRRPWQVAQEYELAEPFSALPAEFNHEQ